MKCPTIATEYEDEGTICIDCGVWINGGDYCDRCDNLRIMDRYEAFEFWLVEKGEAE